MNTTKPQVLLNPLPVPAGPWTYISMDFIGALPKSNGYTVILVLVDRFTKYSHFIPLKHPFTAPVVAQTFLQNIWKLHGPPKSIVSDRDKIFTSSFWRELFKLWNTKLMMSTTYHPQIDGQSERVNQCLEMYLRCAIHDTPTKWHSWLPLAEFWYNTNYHTTLGCSPYKALYGHEPNYGTFDTMLVTENVDVQQWIAMNQGHSALLKEHLLSAQAKVKHYADKHRSDRIFMVGDSVYLKLQPYAQNSVVNRPCKKLAYKYYGPFEILERIGEVAYKLDLPEAALIHPVFHMSQLKEHIPDHTPVFSELPAGMDLATSDTIPEAILDRRLVKRGMNSHLQVLIKWSSHDAAGATWEDYESIKLRFPLAPAWGHAGSEGEATVSAMGNTLTTA